MSYLDINGERENSVRAKLLELFSNGLGKVNDQLTLISNTKSSAVERIEQAGEIYKVDAAKALSDDISRLADDFADAVTDIFK